MSDTPEGYVELENDDFYQRVAQDTQIVIGETLNRLAIGLAVALRPDIERPVGVNGGALLGGALSAIVQFAATDESNDMASIRRIIIDQIDAIIPQVEMQRKMDAVGAVGEGRA